MQWNLPMDEGLRVSLGDRLDSLPSQLFWGDDAGQELASALHEHVSGRRISVLFDERTRQVAGDACLTALRADGWLVSEVLVEDIQGKSPVCDDLTHDALNARLPDCDGIVGIGSGVINDLCKWLGATRGVPYAVYATAASMNGYSSANVAATLRGVKSLVPGHAACVIAANPVVIAAAPPHMAASGLGDMLAKPFSSSDWFLNHVLFAEAFEPGLIGLVDPFEQVYLARADGIASSDPDVLKALFQGLVASGCAMTLHGSSLPASGGEHLISHTLDMMAARDGLAHDLHGRQVGVAAIHVASLYQELLDKSADGFQPRVTPFRRAFWGSSADAVEPQHAAKAAKVAEAVGRLREPGVWEQIKDGVRGLVRSPETIRDALKRAGGAVEPSELGVSDERWQEALRNAGAMRGRFTSLDLALVAGM